jgi:uncharacterized membrane protein YczE
VPRQGSTLADWTNRLARCLFGLALFGAGISCILRSDLGAAPWDVFHQGLSELTGIPIGFVIILVGAALLLLWIPLHQRPGVGTLLNTLEVGLTVDLILSALPHTDRLVPRIAYLAAGIVLIALGSGFYIGAGLGSGARDGIMIGLRDRGISVKWGRTAIEIVVLLIGLALGGTVGIGTLAFTVGIGPLVHVVLPRLTLPPRARVAARRPAVSTGSGRS